MSYYDNAWQGQGRQQAWEQPAPPSRSGTSSAVQREEPTAFMAQFEEIERAIDNLVKSGKMGPGASWPPMGGTAGRRESMPMMPGAGRPYPEFDARMSGSQRHHSVSEYDGMRPHSASNLQSFYANQRFATRGGEPDQMLQAKRRMAAQRERELRNYHQEQQYNRNVSGAKSDRSMSPNAMSEEERRELIARQHRALYGNESTLYASEAGTQRQSSQDARVNSNAGGRGASPLAFDPFMQPQSGEGAVQMPPRDQMAGKDTSAGAQRSRANSTSSPSSNQNNSGSFSLFDNAQQSSRTSNSSPTGGSPPRQGGKATSGASVAPIGTRPSGPQGQATGPSLTKRSTTPLPSPLSYGFTASEQNNNSSTERSTSGSNPTSTVTDRGVGVGWGSNSGVWGNKNTLGVQASVWG